MDGGRTLASAAARALRQAPALDYRPPMPRAYRPKIGLIGCGGIAPFHLRAYRAMGLEVAALCDVDAARAAALARDHYPKAAVYADYRAMLERRGIEVVDIATHPEVREEMIARALRAGKHVLSQKPFVTDLDRGAALCDLAERQGVLLAVNQNGRWAPHLAWMRLAVAKGLIGRVTGVHCAMQWDHNWTAGTAFDRVHHLILYDFAIHWFDWLRCVMGEARATQVFATAARAPHQRSVPPLMAQAAVQYPRAQATLAFDGAARVGPWDATVVVGTKGVLRSEGPHLQEQSVTLVSARGAVQPALEGRWFDEGFQGTMGELLCAIEDGRTPYNDARRNLDSLALCFAACASAGAGAPVAPGAARCIE